MYIFCITTRRTEILPDNKIMTAVDYNLRIYSVWLTTQPIFWVNLYQYHLIHAFACQQLEVFKNIQYNKNSRLVPSNGIIFTVIWDWISLVPDSRSLNINARAMGYNYVFHYSTSCDSMYWLNMSPWPEGGLPPPPQGLFQSPCQLSAIPGVAGFLSNLK